MLVTEYAKQFFLYAKGWYEVSEDPWEDLKKLRSIHYLTIDGKEERDLILNKITQCTIECILEKPRGRSLIEIQELLGKLSPSYYLRNIVYGPAKFIEYNYENELLKECLKIMRFANIDNLNPEIDCRFDILQPISSLTTGE